MCNGRLLSWILLVISSSFLFGCSTHVTQHDSAPKQKHVPDINSVADAKPRALPKSRYGNPATYTVFGKTYKVLDTAIGYKKRGYASWYGTKFHGRLTSSQEPYDMYAMTAASPVLPIPCFVRVTNLENGRSIVVKVNDRGPFVKNRIIDLSFVAAKKLGIDRKGTGWVEVTTIDTRDPAQFAKAPQKQPIARPSLYTTSTNMYLQAGAFGDRHHAYAMQGRLKLLTTKGIVVQKSTLKSKPLYRVQIGPFQSITQLQKLRATLIDHGINTIPTYIRLSRR